MFRVVDGKIHVYGRWIQMIEGEHSITVNSDTGAIVTDGNGPSVCSYTLSGDGKISISSSLPSSGGDQIIKGLETMFQRKISSGPLYEDPYGDGPTMAVTLEGFIFSFNYYAIAYLVSASRPFLWTGGRVCHKTFFTEEGAATGLNADSLYTALPSAMSCGTAGTDTMLREGSVMPPSMGNTAFLNAMASDSLQFLINSTSIVFSYRTHRKYLFFASNVYGLFDTPFGPIGGGDGGMPSGGAINPSPKSFRYSMFSLRQ